MERIGNFCMDWSLKVYNSYSLETFEPILYRCKGTSKIPVILLIIFRTSFVTNYIIDATGINWFTSTVIKVFQNIPSGINYRYPVDMDVSTFHILSTSCHCGVTIDFVRKYCTVLIYFQCNLISFSFYSFLSNPFQLY